MPSAYGARSGGASPPMLAEDRRTLAYARYYRALLALREDFHRSGRFDDAGAKLDEITKLMCISLHEANSAAAGGTDRFSLASLSRAAFQCFGDPDQVAPALRQLSEEVLRRDGFLNADGTSIFGSHPALDIQPTENDFARRIVSAVRAICAVETVENADRWAHLDLLNESFGHFVRDTFRHTKEDAQYMTPPEVVVAMSEMLFADIARDEDQLSRLLGASVESPFLILDPSCGVGSFLVQALRAVLKLAEARGLAGDDLGALATAVREHCLCGQDKVDRMVRLARLNLLLFGGGAASIWQGNSILGPSPLDRLEGFVDVILTNPPFGAQYDADQLAREGEIGSYPLVHALRRLGRCPQRLSSEVLLLDRSLALLRPGGRLLIVLPDGLVSGNGTEASIRELVAGTADLKAVVELPSVTFAHAGTRTRTCAVYLQKLRDHEVLRPAKATYMAVCDAIGYEVVERSGAPMKVPGTVNKLPLISELYQRFSQEEGDAKLPFRVLNADPSAVMVRSDSLLNGRWTPSFYHARRLHALARLEGAKGDGIALKPIAALARLCSRTRRQERLGEGAPVISVLHVGSDGIISLRDVSNYNPKGSGIRCRGGDVLISKINPHIPRVAVVPASEGPLGCSPEFEILEPKPGVDPYLLAALLRLPSVQDQIQQLTSGTSSSHNRIKDTELADILLPIPEVTSPVWGEVVGFAARLQSATEKRYQADRELVDGTLELHTAVERA